MREGNAWCRLIYVKTLRWSMRHCTTKIPRQCLLSLDNVTCAKLIGHDWCCKLSVDADTSSRCPHVKTYVSYCSPTSLAWRKLSMAYSSWHRTMEWSPNQCSHITTNVYMMSLMLRSIGRRRFAYAHKTCQMRLGIGLCCCHWPTSLTQSTQELGNGACYSRRRCRQVEAHMPHVMCSRLGLCCIPLSYNSFQMWISHDRCVKTLADVACHWSMSHVKFMKATTDVSKSMFT